MVHRRRLVSQEWGGCLFQQHQLYFQPHSTCRVVVVDVAVCFSRDPLNVPRQRRWRQRTATTTMMMMVPFLSDLSFTFIFSNHSPKCAPTTTPAKTQRPDSRAYKRSRLDKQSVSVGQCAPPSENRDGVVHAKVWAEKGFDDGNDNDGLWELCEPISSPRKSARLQRL